MKTLFLTITIAIATVVASGCCSSSGTRFGVDIPAGEEAVTLREVLEKPDEYNGKTVVMKGVVSGQCPSLCEFFFKDGTSTATIFPHGFKFPHLKTGRSVTVYARVTSGPGQVVFSALGLRLEGDSR